MLHDSEHLGLLRVSSRPLEPFMLATDRTAKTSKADVSKMNFVEPSITSRPPAFNPKSETPNRVIRSLRREAWGCRMQGLGFEVQALGDSTLRHMGSSLNEGSLLGSCYKGAVLFWGT